MKPLTSTSKLRNKGQGFAYLGILVVSGAAAAIWNLGHVAHEPYQLFPLLGLTFSFFIARVFAIQLPQGDRIYVTLVVGLLGIFLRGAGEVILAATVAVALDMTLRRARGSNLSVSGDAIEAIRSVSVIALLSLWQVYLRPSVAAPVTGELMLAVVLGVGVTYALLDVFTLAVQQWLRDGLGVDEGMVRLLRPLWSVYMVHIALAAVAIRVYPLLGSWGLAIALLLALILQNSFNLYLRIRGAYSQTIGALAHAAELDRPDDIGHAQRVADLAVSVGRQMGASSHDLERIGYAALLHDIGRIGVARLEDDNEHPLRGAAIVDDVPFLEGVALLIAHHREVDALYLPQGAAIVGVCCRFDRLSALRGVHETLRLLELEESGPRRSVVDALAEVLKRESRGVMPAESSP